MKHRLKLALVAVLAVVMLASAQTADKPPVIPNPQPISDEDMLAKIGTQQLLLDSDQKYIAQLRQMILAKQTRIDELEKKQSEIKDSCKGN
jgi:Skp family chaperone for outer membrane proteins